MNSIVLFSGLLPGKIVIAPAIDVAALFCAAPGQIYAISGHLAPWGMGKCVCRQSV